MADRWGEGGKKNDAVDRRGRVGHFFLGCWLMAALVHIAWVPNMVWFMVVEPAPQRSVIEVSTLALVSRPASPPREGGAASGVPREQEIQLPGAAPGGSTSARAPRRHEWERSSLEQRRAAAQRALDHAAEPQPFRPARARRSSSAPVARVSLPQPDDDDIRLTGAPSRDASLMRRRGERRRGEARAEPGRGGAPSAGNRVPEGDGALATASSGNGQGVNPRAARRGARPRRASPRVARGQTSADAARPGLLAGMDSSRQATPRQAATSTPVREARRASDRAERSERFDGGRVSRRSARGDADEARGAGQGGRGRGTEGAGRASNSLFDDYRRVVKTRVQRNMVFPEQLALEMQQGVVVVDITIRHDGHIDRVQVRRSSGFEAFDGDAIQAVHRTDPLPPPPPEELFRRGGESVVLSLQMRYHNPMFN